jgi:heavy metal efflux system protein
VERGGPAWGASIQFRAGLMLVTIGLPGILPAAFVSCIGSDVQRPLATVVPGGLVSTHFPGLQAFPALCCLARVR